MIQHNVLSITLHQEISNFESNSAICKFAKAFQCIFPSVSGQQLDFNNCKSYTQINASNYDRNSSSSNPLGYYASTLPYMDGKKVTPCVSVAGIPSTAYIEIKVCTVPALKGNEIFLQLYDFKTSTALPVSTCT